MFIPCLVLDQLVPCPTGPTTRHALPVPAHHTESPLFHLPYHQTSFGRHLSIPLVLGLSLLAPFSQARPPQPTVSETMTHVKMDTTGTGLNGLNGLNDSTLSPLQRRQRVRPLSSVSATFGELSLGPAVVVPPERMQHPSDAHDTAAAMELAKRRLSKIANEDFVSGPSTPSVNSTTDAYAFAFDIDGVLIRGGEPIPGAIEAMKVLNGENQYGVKMQVAKLCWLEANSG